MGGVDVGRPPHVPRLEVFIVEDAQRKEMMQDRTQQAPAAASAEAPASPSPADPKMAAEQHQHQLQEAGPFAKRPVQRPSQMDKRRPQMRMQQRFLQHQQQVQRQHRRSLDKASSFILRGSRHKFDAENHSLINNNNNNNHGQPAAPAADQLHNAAAAADTDADASCDSDPMTANHGHRRVRSTDMYQGFFSRAARGSAFDDDTDDEDDAAAAGKDAPAPGMPAARSEINSDDDLASTRELIRGLRLGGGSISTRSQIGPDDKVFASPTLTGGLKRPRSNIALQTTDAKSQSLADAAAPHRQQASPARPGGVRKRARLVRRDARSAPCSWNAAERKASMLFMQSIQTKLRNIIPKTQALPDSPLSAASQQSACSSSASSVASSSDE